MIIKEINVIIIFLNEKTKILHIIKFYYDLNRENDSRQSHE